MEEMEGNHLEDFCKLPMAVKDSDTPHLNSDILLSKLKLSTGELKAKTGN